MIMCGAYIEWLYLNFMCFLMMGIWFHVIAAFYVFTALYFIKDDK
jgi:hypothetical protein